MARAGRDERDTEFFQELKVKPGTKQKQNAQAWLNCLRPS